VQLVTDNTANMQKPFRNDPKPVTQDVDSYFNAWRYCGLRFLFCDWLWF